MLLILMEFEAVDPTKKSDYLLASFSMEFGAVDISDLHTINLFGIQTHTDHE